MQRCIYYLNPANPEIYAQRQSIVEHPFGTMKRSWGYDHIMTKKAKLQASSDVGFIFIAYTLKRIMNIIRVEELLDKLAHYYGKMVLKSCSFCYRNSSKNSECYRK